ncbi:MAG: Fur family transcriptional regulator [Gemmatimonadota bacterium]
MSRLPGSDPPEVLLEGFTRYLRDRRLPVTRQRLEVATALFHSPDHPSADRLQRDLAERGVGVGTATVYRTLDLLVESGLVREHDFGEGFRRFEPTSERSRHEHLVCRRCGRAVEFVNERLERMLEMIADEHRFLHRQHRVEIYGLCADCQRRDAADLGATVGGR